MNNRVNHRFNYSLAVFMAAIVMTIIPINASLAQADSESEEQVFEMSQVSEIPTYPGGKRALKDFMQENLIYPATAKENRIEGTVWVEFVVEADGTLREIEVRKGIGFGCQEAALSLIRQMPDWNPGKNQSQSVDTKVILPIPFYRSDVRI